MTEGLKVYLRTGFWFCMSLAAIISYGAGCTTGGGGGGGNGGNGNSAPNENGGEDNDNSGGGTGCVPATTATVSFANDLLPIFQAATCLTSACHGGDFPQNGYSMETYDQFLTPGTTAAALGVNPIEPCDPEASFCFEKISTDDQRVGKRMPEDLAPLSDEEIAMIRTWIEEGAQNN